MPRLQKSVLKNPRAVLVIEQITCPRMSHVARNHRDLRVDRADRFATPYQRTSAIESRYHCGDHALDCSPDREEERRLLRYYHQERVLLVQDLSPWSRKPFSFQIGYGNLENVRVIRSYHLYLSKQTIHDLIDCFLWAQHVQYRIHREQNQFAMDRSSAIGSIAVRFGHFCGFR